MDELDPFESVGSSGGGGTGTGRKLGTISLKLTAESHKQTALIKASRNKPSRRHSGGGGADSGDENGSSSSRRRRGSGRSRSRSGSRGRSGGSRRQRRSRSRGSSRSPPTHRRDPRDKSKSETWNNKVLRVGEKGTVAVHMCDTCERPIFTYGRLIPCKHVFCLLCAEKIKATGCPRCKDPVQRCEQCPFGGIFMCYHGGGAQTKSGCRRTYLSQRDLLAHVEHRHRKSTVRSAQGAPQVSSGSGGAPSVAVPLQSMQTNSQPPSALMVSPVPVSGPPPGWPVTYQSNMQPPPPPQGMLYPGGMPPPQPGQVAMVSMQPPRNFGMLPPPQAHLAGQPTGGYVGWPRGPPQY